MSKGFGGIPGNMQALVKQAQKMQKDLAKAQEESQTLEAEASSGGGVVKVVCNGKYEVVSLTIASSVVVANDIEMLQDLIIAATNEAMKKVQEQVRENISRVTGGVNIPGMF